MKEKRDAALTSGPYSYNNPQKSFQDTINSQQQQHHQQQQQQQKVAPIEYHQKASQIEYYQAPQKQAQVEYQVQGAPQKVAPLDYYQQKQQAPIHVQPQQHFQHEAISQYPTQYSYPTAVESHFGGQPIKNFGDYSFSYPGFESFQQMPIEHYNSELDKISQALVTLQGYKVSSSPFSGYKAESSFPSESYSFGSPAQSYGSPAQAYDFPTHSIQQSFPQHQQQGYVSQYVPSSSVSSGPAASPAHYGFSQSPSSLFVPQTVSINIPSRPTKLPDYASGVKGLGHYSTVSSISAPAPTPAAYKPQSYEIPSYKQQSYEVPVSHLYNQYAQTERPFKASTYLGSSQGIDSHSEQSIANHKPAGEYLPPSKTYLPAKEQYTPTKTYLPAKEQYTPIKEQFAPSKEQYAPEHSPVEYQIQYVQVPQKSYLPPASNSYSPPKSVQEPPKTSYLPPTPVSPPKNQYLPPSQPSNNYLPPSNPFQTSYHSSSTHPLPQQYQQYQQQDSYETHEYQTGGASGHK